MPQLDQSSSRVQSSQRDRGSTPSYLDHPIHFIALPDDVLQHRAFFLDVAVRQCLPVFGLLPFEDQSLLVGMNAFLVFTLAMVSLAFGIGRNYLASQRLDDDLYVTT